MVIVSGATSEQSDHPAVALQKGMHPGGPMAGRGGRDQVNGAQLRTVV